MGLSLAGLARVVGGRAFYLGAECASSICSRGVCGLLFIFDYIGSQLRYAGSFPGPAGKPHVILLTVSEDLSTGLWGLPGPRAGWLEGF